MGELIDRVKGKVKQAEGRVTGNKAKAAEGVAEEVKGKAKGAFEEAKTGIKRAVRAHNNEKTNQKTAGRRDASSQR